MVNEFEIEYFNLAGNKIPVAILGTSPFIGAGQFGAKSSEYYQKFQENPENMVRLIKKTAELGVPAVQVIPYPKVCDAVKEARSEAEVEIHTLGTIGLENYEEELERLIELDAEGIAVHASIADKNPGVTENLLERISETGAAAGIATHEPWRSIDKKFLKRMDFLHAPANSAGYMMGPNSASTLEKLEKFRKPVIAIKPLAAGDIEPLKAFEFLSGKVEGVAVGIASEEEMKETWEAVRKKFTFSAETES